MISKLIVPLLLSCFSPCLVPLQAAPDPQLVKDIWAGIQPGESSNPEILLATEDAIYFRASTATHGQELWKSDGTAAGTLLLKDIQAGLMPGNPHSLCRLGSMVYFSANDGTNGYQLWKTDGTPGGTSMVSNPVPGSGGGASSITAMGGAIYFSSWDPINGTELWKSNGTAAGTAMVKSIWTGSSSSNPSNLVAVGSTLYFIAADGSTGRELWKTDGTAAGTVLVKDIRAGSSSASISSLVVVGSTLYFRANDGINGDELWKSNGTAAGTVMVKDIRSGSMTGSDLENLTQMGSNLFFRATDGVNGIELWKSDGTAAGTVMVKDIRPGLGDSVGSPPFAVVGSTLYFAANDGTNGIELWKSDGTAAGTMMVRDIQSGSGSGFPQILTPVGSTVFFQAEDGVNGPELWKSDGTAVGTMIVKNIVGGSSSPYPRYLTAVGTTLYFSADDQVHGSELWKSDGTETGTVMVKDLGKLPGSSAIDSLTAVGSTLFFEADDGIAGRELWKSNGTVAGTVMVKDIRPGAVTSNPDYLTAVGGVLYFRADDGTSGHELWRSDGTTAGTVMVKDLNPGTNSASPFHLTAVESTLFFSATNGVSGWELWKSNGTAAGTVMVKDIVPGSGSGVGPGWPTELVAIGTTLYFQATGDLWKSDGTAAGTVMVKDMPAVLDGLPTNLTPVGSTLYFSADDGVNGIELWKSDGTAAGTAMVKDLRPGVGSSWPIWMTAVGSTLFFQAYDEVNGAELWKSNGTAAGTILVKDINPGSASGDPMFLTNVNGTLLFRASNPISGDELWKSDGTAAGTVMVKDIWPGLQGSTLMIFHGVVGNRLYFTANDGVSGEELWQSDGSAAGTVRLPDITGDSGGSFPNYGRVVGNRLFIAAQTEATGSELFLYDPALPDAPLITTSAPASLTTTSVVLNGSVNPNGGATQARIEYGLTPSFGSSVTIPLSPTNGTAAQNFSRSLNGLASGSTYHYRYVASNPGGSRATATMTFVTLANSAPTNVVLSPTSIAENAVPNSTVGNFATTDPNAGNTFTYSLTSGTGSANNSTFTITGSTLKINVSPNYEAKSSYAIRVRTTDQDGLFFERALTVLITNVNEAPVIELPSSPLIAEATSESGAVVTFAITGMDPEQGSLAGSGVPESGSTFGLGDTLVNASVTDSGSLAAAGSFIVRVQDTTAPVVSVPGDVTVESTSSEGTLVTYAAAMVDDAVGVTSLVYSQASGTVFPIGETLVTITATDAAGNTGTGSFTVTVIQIEPPVVSLPASSSITTTSAMLGGTVTGDGGSPITERGIVYGVAASNPDPVMGDSGVIKIPGTGTTGAFMVVAGDLSEGTSYSFKAYATNAAGTSYSPVAIFTTVSTNADLASLSLSEGTLEPGFASAIASYVASVPGATSSILVTPTTANDFATVRVNGQVTASGSASDAIGLSHGENTIVIAVTAQEGTTTRVYSVVVTRTGTPTGITLTQSSIEENVPPDSIVGTLATEDAEDQGGFVYTFASGIGDTDNARFALTGDVLSIIESPDYETKDSYSIRVRTTDMEGLFHEEVFTIAITDVNEVPVLQLPGSPLIVEATGESGAIVSFEVSATDPELGTLVAICSPPGGSSFPSGDTTVSASVTDAGGLTVTGSFTVRVQDTTAPVITSPEDITVATLASGGGVVTYDATVTDAVGVSSLDYSHPSGSVFPVGRTTVTITASDAAQNSRTASFTVTVIASPATTLFKGYQGGGGYYLRYAFTDWDGALGGVGIEADSPVHGADAPAHPVDGHVILEADGTDYCTVIKSTGTYATHPSFAVGMRHPISIQSSYWFNAGPGTVVSDTRFDKAPGFHNLLDGLVPVVEGPPADATAWYSGDGDGRELTGDGPDLVRHGDASHVVGKVGQAFHLDGSGDHIEITDHPSHRSSTGSITAECWVKFHHVSGLQVVLAKPVTGSTSNSYAIWMSGAYLFAGNGSNAGSLGILNSNGPLAPETWHHVAFTLRGTRSTLYLNGVVQASSTSAPPLYFDPPTSSRPLLIGADNEANTTPVFHANAVIDEVSIHDQALTHAEIAAIHSAGVMGKTKAVATPAGIQVQSRITDVEVTFAETSAAGTTRQTGLDIATLPALPAGHTFTGLAYELSSDASYQVTAPDDLKATFHVPALASRPFSLLRVLHLEDGSWVDRTASASSAPLLQTTGLPSLGTFAITEAEPVFVGVEAWQRKKFGADYNDPAIGGLLADPNQNGLSNLLEYALGQDPLASGGASPLRGSTIQIGMERFQTLSFTRPIGEERATDVTYTPMRSETLNDGWSGENLVLHSTTSGPDDLETVTYRSLIPMGSRSKEFLRLQVTIGSNP